MKWIVTAILAAHGVVWAAHLKPQTSEVFDRYFQQVVQRRDARTTFLWADQSPERAKRIKDGEVLVAPAGSDPEIPAPNGIIHDWIGSAFLPGVTIEQTMALVRDYSRHKQYYAPEVADSRILSHNGDDYRIDLRLLKKQIVTVVLDTEHEVHYTQLNPKKWQSTSRTIRISEIQDGKTLPPGTGHGFLWRLNSYWRFEERDGGTWIECEAVSLTRDIPTGLGWAIDPIIRKLPKESLANTLKKTRVALVHEQGNRESTAHARRAD